MTNKVCRTCNDSGVCDRCGGYSKMIDIGAGYQEEVKGCEYCDYTGECPYCKEHDLRHPFAIERAQDRWFARRQREFHD